MLKFDLRKKMYKVFIIIQFTRQVRGMYIVIKF